MGINVYVEYLEGEKHDSSGADISENHETFQDAGYLLTDVDLIIDIDNLSKEQIKDIISYFEIKHRLSGQSEEHISILKNLVLLEEQKEYVRLV